VIRIGGEVPTDGGNEVISYQEPYRVEIAIEGSADILFHRWNAEAVDEKAAAAKGSKAKKTDNIESYVYRDEAGFICIPGEYIRGAIVKTAKFRQDPRSSRKSAEDLFKAAVVSLTPLASLGVKDWDYEDRRRAVVQRAGINRTRPAMKAGWKATFVLLVTLPEYVSPQILNEVVSMAGRINGLGDFRPTYGRFQVTSFKVLGI
jgi:hypothetical protein